MRPVAVVAAGLAALALTACGSSGPSSSSYYVARDASEIVLVTWSPPHNGHARGTITNDSITGTAPDEAVRVQTVAVNVTINGGDVILKPAGLYAVFGYALAGTLSADSLGITPPPDSSTGQLWPTTLSTSDPASYNKMLARLHTQVGHVDARAAARQRRQAAQQQQQQQQRTAVITADQSKLATDAGTLLSDAANLATDVSTLYGAAEQAYTDLGTVNSDAANGQGSSCDNSSTVNDDAVTVNADGSAMGGDMTGLVTDISGVDTDISNVNADVSQLQADGGTPDPSTHAAVSEAQSDISGAVGQANTYASKVNGYLQQAYTVAGSVAGSACPGPGAPTYVSSIS